MSFNEVAQLIEPTIRDLGFDLVQVRIMGGARRTLQVMAEPADRGRTMTVDDCAAISRAVSAVLDVADPIEGAYSLEVSSPGIDRPLVRPVDFERFSGFEAKVECEPAVQGRKRFKGLLRGLEGTEVVIEEAGARMSIPFESVRKAKLVLSADLLARAAGGRG
ncbi:MAG: ribosome maturation factor RimP [Geminicoccaceae bacterium]